MTIVFISKIAYHYHSFASLHLLQKFVQMRTNGLGEELLSIESLSSVFLLLLGTLWQLFDSYLDLHFSALMMRLLEELLKHRLLVLTQKRAFKSLIDLLVNRLKSLECHILVIVLSFHL